MKISDFFDRGVLKVRSPNPTIHLFGNFGHSYQNDYVFYCGMICTVFVGYQYQALTLDKIQVP
nr:MAG TPA: hypothetical protein [Caudoviricetes sp.]